MGGELILVLAAARALSFDPAIDQGREPPSGLALGLGLERLDDTFGFWLELRSPRLLDDNLCLALGGSFGWFPSRLPATETEPAVGPWVPFGQVRLRAELGARIAESPHRVYVAAGPTALFPSEEISRTPIAPGASVGLGMELFVGDRYTTSPVALVLELGGSAHLASADVRIGEAENAAPLATGFALSVGLRAYPAEPRRPLEGAPGID